MQSHSTQNDGSSGARASSLSPTAAELREGDVYRWSYREPGDDRMWGRYHCKSMIAIVKDGRLRDTYWQIGGSFSSGSFSFGIDDLHRFNLKFLGNLSDLDNRPEYDADYYADEDIVNLNHSNSSKGNFYIRKDAQRSADKMLATAQNKIADAESKKRSAEATIERMLARIAEIERGDTSGYL